MSDMPEIGGRRPLPINVVAGESYGWGSRGNAMVERRGPGEQRVWALRDRGVVPVNKIRARAMRSAPSKAEQKLWWHLRHRVATPSHFRRQVHLGHYIVDFASHSLRIVIELDGGQ